MAWQDDPLDVRNPRRLCKECNAHRRRRRRCEACGRTGYEAIDLAGSWRGKAAFLCCGGPSLATYPLDALRDRGVVSLGVNNAAAYAQCNAFVFGDPQWKFHHSLFMDPKTWAFAPMAKLRRQLRVQAADGTFRFADVLLQDLPGNYGIPRSGRFDGKTFLSTPYAHWGHGGKGDVEQQPFRRLCTMLMGIRLLHYLGAERVYMLGVDFWMDKEQAYAWGGDATSGNRICRKINAMLEDAAGTIDRAGMAIWNCNQDSGCTVFPYARFADALQDCRSGLPAGAEPPDLSLWYRRSTMEEQRERHPENVPEKKLPQIL